MTNHPTNLNATEEKDGKASRPDDDIPGYLEPNEPFALKTHENNSQQGAKWTFRRDKGELYVVHPNGYYFCECAHESDAQQIIDALNFINEHGPEILKQCADATIWPEFAVKLNALLTRQPK